jgi:RHS repeat-associated protein
LEFAYDYKNRRIAKRVYVEESATGLQPVVWRLTKDLRFVYDGWHMIAELDATFATGTGVAGITPARGVVRTYLWGPDVSGTMTGAGGVGGLLAFTFQGDGYYPISDANGNITAIHAPGIDQVIRFDYDPFGNRLTNTGPDVEICPMGFSSKYTDSETGLVDYGLRIYSPSMARFLSRDPIQEQGGINLYGFVGNDPVNHWDYLGLWKKVGKWSGQRGKYQARAVAEEGDTRESLNRLMFAQTASSRKGFVGPDQPASPGCEVDLAPMLSILESLMRSNCVKATSAFNALGGGVAHQRFIPTNRANEYFRPNCTRPADCHNAAMLVLAKGLSDTLNPAEFGSVGYTVERYPLIYLSGIGSEADAMAGDWGWFAGVAGDLSDWKGENMVKISADNWWGYGGGTRGMSQSLNEWAIEVKNNSLFSEDPSRPVRGLSLTSIRFIDVVSVVNDLWKKRGGH